MTELNCLRCKTPIDPQADACPECGERVTSFQRTYSTRLLDGKYQILERLGLGGMGEIFKVRHIHLNELRVVKIMRSNIATDEQALQRFLHEARLATMIKHRNLAMLYDFSTLDDGSYYMVWEFIEGTNIQKWIASNGPFPARLAIEIAIQALSGLEALHQMGIIHRDISPENIMLSQDHMGKLLVKVIDFGIAKQLSDEPGGGQGLTQTGMFLGKLKYASPEQAGFIKEGEQLDARSDLYTFGVVFYEMLAGRAPFVATNPHGYILKHATEKPLGITQTSPDVKVPEKLEAIVLRSLEKDRDARHVNAEEFIHDLEQLRSEIPPEEKFGLGERMATMSSRMTTSEPRPTSTGRTSPATVSTGATAIGSQPASSPTVVTSAGADATMVTRGGGDATVVESRPQRTQTPAEPTVVTATTGADASPTVMEPRHGGTNVTADPTVMEQLPHAAPKKSKGLLIGGVAAAVILIAAIGWFATRGGDEAVEPGTTTDVTAAPPIASDKAIVQLTTMGTLESIVDRSTNEPIDLGEEDPTTPLRVQIPPGSYTFTVRNLDDQQHTLDVTLAAGDVRPLQWPGRSLDYEAIAKDILQQ